MKIYHILVLLAGFWLVGCNSNLSAADSPSNILMQYIAASQKQDIVGMKALLSKSSLEYIEKNAKLQNLTIDDILRQELSIRNENIEYKLETRNEKIEGDTATVEFKNEMNGGFDMKMPFVRENGTWKLARDKYIEEEFGFVILDCGFKAETA